MSTIWEVGSAAEKPMTNTGDQTSNSEFETKKKMLRRADEIRKFEIGLYWRRATYFWTLIGAAFVAFFAIQAVDGLGNQKKQVFSFIVANLGFVFSIGWFFVNRGSKFWQENWETHVDRLEKSVNEDLYRLVVYSRTDRDCWLTDAAPYSVSKINQMTSVYVTVLWAGLGLWSFVQLRAQTICPGTILVIFIVATVLTLGFSCLFCCKGKTRVKKRDYSYHFCMVERTAKQCCSKHESNCECS